MTPLIREMVAFTGSIDDSPLKPEEMMWFDAGRLSPTEAIRVPAIYYTLMYLGRLLFT